MKRVHDKKHREDAFVVGDWVWLHLSHRLAASVRPAWASKLSAKYFGPYQVIEKIGTVSYRLQLSAHAKIHSIFPVVFLKKFEGPPPTVTPLLPPIVHGRAVPTLKCVVHARPTATSWELQLQW
jgi:hypothetical protein